MVPIDVHGHFPFSKGQHLVSFHREFVKVVHPTNRATACSIQTVGFNADTSDIEITLERFHLAHDIELLASALFEHYPSSKHEDTHLVTLLNAYIGQFHGIVDGLSVIGRDDKQDFHGIFSSS
ncbi:MAG: hypothetical protein ISR62_07980 [Desulfobacteraceae bacterium]|nr:hypothetical protein [Desulfobacterales bacterium]MBL6968343.1 hypothetical protein [Desulfobacteraceae bacterium]MBL7173753.1 hypothetical protein [Desulfobacteraceae bacterium]